MSSSTNPIARFFGLLMRGSLAALIVALAGVTVLGMIAAIFAVVVIVGFIIVWFWNEVMVSFLSLDPIATIFGALLFLLAVGCVGRFIGFLALLAGGLLFVTGGQFAPFGVDWTAGQMAGYGLFMLIAGSIFGFGTSSSDKKQPHN